MNNRLHAVQALIDVAKQAIQRNAERKEKWHSIRGIVSENRIYPHSPRVGI